jgi:hypothetical protein
MGTQRKKNWGTKNGTLEWVWNQHKSTICIHICQIQSEIVAETSNCSSASQWAQVCLPSVAEILSPGNVKAFVVELAAPSMRHLRDPQWPGYFTALWVGGSPEWAYLRFLNVLNPVNGLIFYKAIKKTKILGYSTIPVSTWAYFLKGLKHKKNPKTNPKKI